MRILRCGIAGFGFIGPHHADAMRRLGFVEVAGICTSEPAAARKKAEQFGIPRAFDSFGEMVRAPEIDVIDIITPTWCIIQWQWRRSPPESTSSSTSRSLSLRSKPARCWIEPAPPA